MKKNLSHTIKHVLLSFSIVVISFSQVSGQVTESRKLTKGFKIDNSTIVDIGNKYGDINIENWDNDSVKVEIYVQVTEKSRDKLRKKMSEISFELTQSGHYIVINTLIGDTKNILFSEFNKLKETVGLGDSEVEINMKLKVPDNLDLRITNKFGNVYIDNYTGDVTLEMSNGKLKANDLTGYVNMKISFGDAIINSIDSGSLEVYYGKLILTSGGKIRVTSKTSDITITEINQLTVNSSRDTYRIRMIDDFQTESSWTDFTITEFKHKSDVRMRYGDLSIENIKNTFDNIYIDASSSKISLCLDKKTDVNFDITTDKDLSLPMNSKVDKKEQIDQAEKLIRYTGRTGDIKIDNPKLILKTSSGEITILKR